MGPHLLHFHGGEHFPDDLAPDENGLVAMGGWLTESVLVEAYSKGIFPWYIGPPVMWFSPDPRAVLYPQDLHVSRRLARVLRQGRFEVRFDTDFDAVIDGCAEAPRPGQEGTWIDEEFKAAYRRLFRRHLVHCVAVYREGKLAGGLYGVSLGRVFFGESMFHRVPDASKVALVHLVDWVRQREFALIDCQARTGHLERMGAVEVPREEFLRQLRRALQHPTRQYTWR
jgi:leucyl/phenylalanyl-tRNA--protein transferase